MFRKAIIAATALASVGLGTTSSAFAEGASFPDPAGDTASPHLDIVQLDADYSDVDLFMAGHVADYNSTFVETWAFDLSVTGTPTFLADFTVLVDERFNTVTLLDSAAQVVACNDLTGSRTNTGVAVLVPEGCIGAPQQLWMRVETRSPSGQYTDQAPNNEDLFGPLRSTAQVQPSPSPSPSATPTPSPTPTPTEPDPSDPPAEPAPGPVPDEPGTKRLAGNDRYATAAAIVQDSFPSGPVPVVFIATGEAFADALAGGPAADVLGGPVLPVAKAGIPAPILSELERLDPTRIVILGGPGAVSDAIATQLQTYTAGTVRRIAGVNRYDTAAQVATQVFTAPVPQVLIATGLGFADALPGGAVGATTTSPVLLVGPNSLPPETAAALQQLQPRDIAVLGGPNAVSDAVVEQLRGFTTGGVNRLAGTSRYETAARVAQIFWPTTSQVVYLASGLNFPDALAGVPAAGRDDAPLLLVDPTCMPAATRAELDRLQPSTVVVLGGPGAVSDAAAAGTVCAPPLPVARVSLQADFSTVEGAHYISGDIAPCAPGKLVRLYKVVDGRGVLVASMTDGYVDCTIDGPGDTHWGTWYSFGQPGTYTFIARTVTDGGSSAGASPPAAITVQSSEVNSSGSDVAFQLG